ncbi:MAG: hypothetical protein GQ536_04625, partial [Candidatus Aminicenantes bacterium]|nr:hypothetical protein [Candidatus Aminicenantes bacterium]
MRIFLTVLFVCLLAIPIAAQRKTGNIYGTVVDDEGNLLPGVSITLSGPFTAAVPAVTSAAGKFRFLYLFPGNKYEIRAEIAGFKTKVETGVIVNAGVITEITIVMEVKALEEEEGKVIKSNKPLFLAPFIRGDSVKVTGKDGLTPLH